MSAAATLRSLPRTTSRRGLESPDAALISASRAGDSRAFEELYRRYRAGIRDLCQRMLGDTAKAEDLTQETFIRAYVRMERFQEGKSLWPWLSTIAHHLCIDEIRGRRRAPIASEEAETETETDLAGDLTSDEAIARHERAQLRARLSSALATLQPSDRRVVFLRSVEEWTYEDIARADGRTVDAIRNAAWRARTTLRTLLDTERERTGTSVLGFSSAFVLSLRSALERIRTRTALLGKRLGITGYLPMMKEPVAAYLGIASIAFALLSIHDFNHDGRQAFSERDITPLAHQIPDAGDGRRLDVSPHSLRQPMNDRPVTDRKGPIQFSFKQKPPHPGGVVPRDTEGTLIVEIDPIVTDPIWYENETRLKCKDTETSLLPKAGPIRSTC